MSSQNNSSSGGIGFAGVLFLIFLVLKLVGTINWSWWWVTAPLWGGLAVYLLLIIIVVTIKLISRL